jgi:hypothetical protein
MTDRQTHTPTHTVIQREGGSREWSILIPKLLAIARSLDNIIWHLATLFFHLQRTHSSSGSCWTSCGSSNNIIGDLTRPIHGKIASSFPHKLVRSKLFLRSPPNIKDCFSQTAESAQKVQMNVVILLLSAIKKF